MSGRRWCGCAWLAAAGLAVGSLGARPASALPTLDVALDIRFGSGVTGHFGTVRLTETGDGGVEMTVHLLSSLGPNVDLDELYFNLPSALLHGLTIETLSDVPTPFTVQTGGAVRGGAGSDFDVAVSFGNGRGRSGNGQLQVADFVLRGSQPLTIAALVSETSETSQGIFATFAAHTQGSRGGGSTVGGFVVPEPATALLLGAGLVALGARSRRRR